jgi:hypothetical protein
MIAEALSSEFERRLSRRRNAEDDFELDVGIPGVIAKAIKSAPKADRQLTGFNPVWRAFLADVG